VPDRISGCRLAAASQTIGKAPDLDLRMEEDLIEWIHNLAALARVRQIAGPLRSENFLAIKFP
jgi:hypothetical protein